MKVHCAARIAVVMMAMLAFCTFAKSDMMFIVNDCNRTSNIVYRYDDGSELKEDERYALVWTKNGTLFSGFNVDGTLVSPSNSNVIAFLPIKKRSGGKICPTLVQIADGEEKYSNGTFSICLLDTRFGLDTTNTLNSVSRIRKYAVIADGWKYEIADGGILARFEFLGNQTEMIATNGFSEDQDVNPDSEIVDANPKVPNNPLTDGGESADEPIDRNGETDVVVVEVFMPSKFTKGLVKNRWKSMYKKTINEEIFQVFKKKKVKLKSYNNKTYIIYYKIYNLVPESYLGVCNTKKYINRFSEHWVIDSVFVVERKTDAKNVYSVTSYEVTENFGMVEFDYFECTKKERSKVIKELRKIGLK